MRIPPVNSGPGFVLLSVLIVVLLASMVAISLLFSMRADNTAFAAGEQGEQAWAVALSGIDQAIRVAKDAPPGTLNWRDNPAVFQQQLVCEDGSEQWYFSVYEQGEDKIEGVRFGMADEASKLNLLHANPEWLKAETNKSALLLALTPAETGSGSDLTAATNIFAANSTAAYFQEAEQALGYSMRPAKNGQGKRASTLLEAVSMPDATMETAPPLTPPRSVAKPATSTNDLGAMDMTPNPAPETAPDSNSSQPEEKAGAPRKKDGEPVYAVLDAVFAAKGYNPRLLYGKDLDLNFQRDATTEGDTNRFAEYNGTGLDFGLRQYLTAISYDLNVDSEGQPRLNLNDTNTDLTKLELPEATVNYLKAMWKAKQVLAHPADLLGAKGTFKDEQNKDVELESGVQAAELAILLNRSTTTNANRLEGLININTAPAEVLAVIPGIDSALAESIVGARQGLSDEMRQTPAWLIQQGVLEPEQFKKIAPYLTTRSYQFHFHVVAYAIPSGRYRVLEAIIDVAPNPPRIVLIRDLTRMGMPFKIEMEPNSILMQSAGRKAKRLAMQFQFVTFKYHV